MPPIRDPLTGRFTRSDEPAEASSSTAEPAAADVEDIMRKFGTFDQDDRLVCSFVDVDFSWTAVQYF